MKKYYYFDGKDKQGPISFDELKQKKITDATLIWFEGLEEWEEAKNIYEMKSILELNPPPISELGINSEVDNEFEIPLENEEKANNKSSTKLSNQGMFSSPFSYEGRIRRTEYGLSLIIYIILAFFINIIVETGEVPIIGFAYIPLLWFLWAQGAKRCHDLGNSGWWQLIPLYGLWMLFENGQPGFNEYGLNPKE